MQNRHSSYLSPVFNKKQIKATVKRCREALKDVDYDAIVVTGVSGLSIGATVAYLTGKQLVVIRKENEQTHASYDVEGLPCDDFKYVILDDFVSVGNTVIKIAERMQSYARAKFVGLIQYSEHRKTLCVTHEDIWKKAWCSVGQAKYEKFISLI